MKLCGFEVGLDKPLFLIAGAVGGRSRGPALRGCDPGDGRRAGGEGA
jgi:hypothetical protein